MGESDVPQINCSYIIGQLIHHACYSKSEPHDLQLFIKLSYITIIQGACPTSLCYFREIAFSHFKPLVKLYM